VQVRDVSALDLLCDQARQHARDGEDQLEATESRVQALEQMLRIETERDDEGGAAADLSQRRKRIALKIRQLKKACKVGIACELCTSAR